MSARRGDTTILDLPADLLALVASHLEEVVDKACFMVAHSSFHSASAKCSLWWEAERYFLYVDYPDNHPSITKWMAARAPIVTTKEIFFNVEAPPPMVLAKVFPNVTIVRVEDVTVVYPVASLSVFDRLVELDLQLDWNASRNPHAMIIDGHSLPPTLESLTFRYADGFMTPRALGRLNYLHLDGVTVRVEDLEAFSGVSLLHLQEVKIVGAPTPDIINMWRDSPIKKLVIDQTDSLPFSVYGIPRTVTSLAVHCNQPKYHREVNDVVVSAQRRPPHCVVLNPVIRNHLHMLECLILRLPEDMLLAEYIKFVNGTVSIKETEYPLLKKFELSFRYSSSCRIDLTKM